MSHDGWQNSARSWILSFKPHSNGFRVILMTLFFQVVWFADSGPWYFQVCQGHSALWMPQMPFQLRVLALTNKKQPSWDKCLLRDILTPRFYRVSLFLLNLSVVMYRKFRNVPISRVDTDVLMEVAYSFNFLAVSDSSTCPDIGTSWCHAGIIEHFEIRGFKMTP